MKLPFAITLLAWLLVPITGHAACNLYLMPVASGPARTRIADNFGAIVPASTAEMRWGPQGVAVVFADVSAADDVALVARPDVFKIPATLDNTLGAAGVTTVQTALETRHIPAGWITQGMTYRQVLRTVFRMFQYFQRWRGITKINTAQIGQSGVTLDTQFQNLPAVARQGLLDAATSFDLSTAGLTATATLRTIFKNVADQMPDREIKSGCGTV